MRYKIIIVLCILLLLAGCNSYGNSTVHPCEQPYSINLDCELALACNNSDPRVGEHIIEQYIEDKCI